MSGQRYTRRSKTSLRKQPNRVFNLNEERLREAMQVAHGYEISRSQFIRALMRGFVGDVVIREAARAMRRDFNQAKSRKPANRGMRITGCPILLDDFDRFTIDETGDSPSETLRRLIDLHRSHPGWFNTYLKMEGGFVG